MLSRLSSPLRRSIRSVVRLVAFTLALCGLGALTPRIAEAQAKWYTITAINGVTYQYYDASVDAAVWNVNVTVKNTQGWSTYLLKAPSCGAFTTYMEYRDDYACPYGAEGTWINTGQYLAPNQTATVSFPIYVNTASKTGSAFLQVTGSYLTGVSSPHTPGDSRIITVTVTNWTPTAQFALPPLSSYTPYVTPKATSVVVPQAVANTQTFTIQNNGSLSAVYSLAAACGSMPNCSQNKTGTTIAAGATDDVVVTFTTPAALNASNTVSLTATYTNENNQSISDNASVTVNTPNTQPAVTPKSGTAIIADNGSGSATFTVSSMGSSYASNIVPICEGWATGCAVTNSWYPDPNNPGNYYFVTVGFQAPQSSGGPGVAPATIRLGAQLLSGGLVIAADTGWLPTVRSYGMPSLSPKNSSVQKAANMEALGSLSVTNSGNVTSSYSWSVSCTGVANCGTLYFSTFTLAAGASTTVYYSYTAPPVGQSGTSRVIVSRSGVEADTATTTITAADLLAPTYAYLVGVPSEGSTVTGSAVTMTMIVCDADGQLGTPTAVLNGVALTPSFSASSQGGCFTAKSGTLSGLAQPGANTLVLSVSDGYHTTGQTVHFTYDESWNATPVVTYQNYSRLLRDGIQSADTFYVRNPGPLTFSYTVSPGCVALVNCTISQSPLSVAAGQTAKVWITYATNTSSSGANVWPVVSFTGTSGRTVVVNDVYTMLTIDRFAPVITMASPSNGSTIDYFPTITTNWCDADGQLNAHTATLDGVALSSAFTAQTASGCTSAGVSSWPLGFVALGTHTIVATATDVAGHVTSLTSTFTLALPPVMDFKPLVSPRTPTPWLVPQPQTQTWAVRNVGTRSARYHVVPDCSAIITVSGCSVNKNDFTVAPNAVDSVVVGFEITSLPATPKTLKLIASYTDIVGQIIADTGTASGRIPTVQQLYQPLVVGPMTAWSLQPGAINGGYSFTIKNLGVAPVTYTTTVAFTGGFSTTSFYPPAPTVTLNPGETTFYTYNIVAPGYDGAQGTTTVLAQYTTPEGVTVSSEATAELVTLTPFPAAIVTTPGGATQAVSSVGSVIFNISNSGNVAISVQATVECDDHVVIGCRFDGPAPQSKFLPYLPLGLGEMSGATVAFNIAPAGGSFGWVKVTVEGAPGTIAQNIHIESPVMISRTGSYTGVKVTPQDQPPLQVKPDRDIEQRFIITNTGTLAERFAYFIKCTNVNLQEVPSVVSCNIPSDTTRVLAPGEADTVRANFRSTSTNVTGRVTLAAVNTLHTEPENQVQDVGSATFTLGTPADISVDTRSVNPGQTIARSQCLTIAAGDNAAYECGDLRVVHPLPATTTMGKSRAPTLVYNSAHARGRGVVSADVTLSAGVYPSQVRATLKIKDAMGVVKVDTSRNITWKREWSDGHPRRISIPFNGSGVTLVDPTKQAGAFEYTFEVKSLDDNGATYGTSTDTIIVVDRNSSPFGKGWWLDGLEEIIVPPDSNPADTRRLWIGGDGSARVYTQVSGGVWTVYPSVDRPDTLLFVGGHYQRRLSNGAYVEFDATGKHVATVTQQQHATVFGYDAATGLLQTITLPTPTGSPVARVYAFTYDPTSHRLAGVDAPMAGTMRHVTVTPVTAQDGSTVIDRITDPDGKYVTFGRDQWGLVTSRTDRRTYTTTYEYEMGFLRRSTLDMAGTAPTNIVHTFCAGEGAGQAPCSSAIDSSGKARTLYDGPRTDAQDTTAFYLTRFGSPAKIVNALGYVTSIERTDPHWPILATGIVEPNGHRVNAEYHATRGVLTKTIDRNPVNTGDATTIYAWNPTSQYNLLEQITAPTGQITTFGYFANGDRQWQQDGRGTGSRVSFTHNSDRQPETVTTPATSNVNRYEYDSYGNLRKTTTPSGIVTEAFKDALGRDTLVKTPTDPAQTDSLKLRHRIVYDASERDSMSVEWNGADSLIVKSLYDNEDGLTEVSQEGWPDAGNVGAVIRRFVNDAAGRKISERIVHGATPIDEEVLHWIYDPAGNLINGGRDAYLATLGYDAVNRLTSRVGTLTALYTYDKTGMRTANNEAAHISRSYYPNGSIRTDTLRIAKADWGTDFSAHEYGLSYTYDLSGRRKTVTHPSQLAGSGTSVRTKYDYNTTTGLLETVTDKFEQQFRYDYDYASRLSSQVWRFGSSSPVTEVHGYDDDSRLAHRGLTLDAQVLHDETFAYDARDKVINVSRTPESAARDTFTYDVRGRTTKSVLGSTTETLQLDGLGNAIVSSTKRGRPGAAWSRYERGSGRLLYRTAPGQTTIDDSTSYDIDLRGNVYHTRQAVIGGPYTSPSSNYYDFLTFRTNTEDTFDDRGRLLSHTLTYDTTFHQNPQYDPTAFSLVSVPYQSEELYRYDALGRRVWVRSMKGATCDSPSGSPDKWTGCHSSITRTIWDGDQILYEVRGDGSANADAGTLEDDGAAGPHTGTIGYVHGYGIDEPLALDKSGYKILPFADWRGHFDLGVCDTAKCASTGVKFPERNVFGAANWAGNLPAPNWFGSLIEGQVDASGYVYRRNRYFDTETGRFTQEDPIGLAGGLNLYGFAGGDPVNYTDPFGLYPDCSTLPCPLIAGGAMVLGGPLTIFGAAVIGVFSADLAFGQHADWPYHPRPGFRKGTNDDVESSLTPGARDNTYVCPTCSETLPVRNPDGSRAYDKHHTGKSWAERLLDLKEKGADRSEIRDEYQREVQARCPSCNRGDNKRPEQKKPENPQ